MDFGNIEVVPNDPDHIRSLPFCLEILPSLVYACCLPKFVEVDLKLNGESSQSVIEKFNGANVKFISSNFENKNAIYEVELIKDRIYLSNELVRLGLARKLV